MWYRAVMRLPKGLDHDARPWYQDARVHHGDVLPHHLPRIVGHWRACVKRVLGLGGERERFSHTLRVL